MTEFEKLVEELQGLLRLKHDVGRLKLLNVGTDRPGEHHWRFKVPSGEIITICIGTGKLSRLIAEEP